MSLPSKAVIVFGSCMAAAACTGLYRAPVSEPSSLPHQATSDDYVDPTVCATCHQDIATSYRVTGMGQSFHQITTAEARSPDLVGDFSNRNRLYNSNSDRYYSMLANGEDLYESRFQLGFDGNHTNQVEMRIDYVIGSGRHARTFLHRTPEGKLLELPVSWFSESGGHWGMSPGYDNAHQLDFRRAIDYECMSCHNGYPSKDQFATAAPDRNLFGDKLPSGIDCQRCHGPGGAHVRAALSKAPIGEIEKSIIDPSRLSRDRQMDVCMQCHLETTSRPLPHSLHLPNWQPFSYRPGTPLTDDQIYFDRQPGRKGHFEVAHQAYQLRRSACFRNSDMTCITCHDPHVESHGPEEVKRYVDICKTCHATVHTGRMRMTESEAGPNCLTCHMWKERTDDAVHVVMTNHYIQRLRPVGDLMSARSETAEKYSGEVVPYYPNSLRGFPDGDIYGAIAQIEDDSNLVEGAARLEHAIQNSNPEQAEFYFAMGAADSKLGKDSDAITWYKEALKRKPQYELALRALGVSYEATGDFASAAQTDEQAAKMSPPDTAVLTNLGRVYLKMGRTGDAKRVLRGALDIDAGLPQAALLLGLTEVQSGNDGAAEAMFRSAINLQPDIVEPHNNLAALLVRKQRFDEAEFQLQKSKLADPQNAVVRYNLGLMLANRGSLAAAKEELNTAEQLQPKLIVVHIALGDVLKRAGDLSGALAEYKLALGLDQRDGAANLHMAELLSISGKSEEAKSYYLVAAQSSDQQIREAALKALK